MQIQIWIYTICKSRVYPGSAGQGLEHDEMAVILEHNFTDWLNLDSFRSTFSPLSETLELKLNMSGKFSADDIYVLKPFFFIFSQTITFTTLLANSADDTKMIFYLFSQTTGYDMSCKLWQDFNMFVCCIIMLQHIRLKFLKLEKVTILPHPPYSPDGNL